MSVIDEKRELTPRRSCFGNVHSFCCQVIKSGKRVTGHDDEQTSHSEAAMNEREGKSKAN